MNSVNVYIYLGLAGLGCLALLALKLGKRARAKRQRELGDFEIKLNKIVDQQGATANVNMLKEIALLLLRIEQQLKRIA